LATLLGTSEGKVNQEILERLTKAYSQQLTEQMQGEAGQVLQDYLTEFVGRYVNEILAPALSEQLGGALSDMIGSYAQTIGKVIGEQIQGAMEQAMGQLADNLGDAFTFDTDAFKDAFKFDMTEEELTELMMSMMRVEEHSYDNNLKKLGYANFDKPSEISIYPRDFDSKAQVIAILDGYNDRMREVDEDKVVSYTDLVGTLMSSVTTIVNMISYVLIAFVAISLIVSSIMIGVITYISVLERKKEIGILRSIGASKGDISRVFNAETIIEGLIAGLLGVGVTALACIPANMIVYEMFDVPNVALLPPAAAAILVVISVVLTFVAGIIPSGSASRKDPVEALRSE
jgi:ABC-type antimicrobial peptide transport system permease subunit